jgi:hypothetical protein
LVELIQQQALADRQKEPTLEALAVEIFQQPKGGETGDSTRLKNDLILARNLSDPDVQKAATKVDALKLLHRKEEVRKNVELAASMSPTFNSSVHTLLRGDCLELMATLPANSFDVICSDPPYGINAQDFNNSGGLTGGTDGSHFYDDSYPTWQRLMRGLVDQCLRLAKPQAHLYLFCDIDRFAELRDIISADRREGGFKVFRTPLIWFNPGGSRAPWPNEGPQRKSQYILYGVRGNRPYTR